MPNLKSSLCTFPTALQETPNPVRLPLEHILLKGQFPTIRISALQQLPSRRLSFSIVTETSSLHTLRSSLLIFQKHTVFSRRGGGGGETPKNTKHVFLLLLMLTYTNSHRQHHCLGPAGEGREIMGLGGWRQGLLSSNVIGIIPRKQKRSSKISLPNLTNLQITSQL